MYRLQNFVKFDVFSFPIQSVYGRRTTGVLHHTISQNTLWGGCDGMSSGWICWRYENVGEFVSFLLKVGEIWHFHPLPFSNVSFSPTFFFTHLQILPTCRFHLLVDFVFTHFFFFFTHLQISPTCRFRFHPLLFPISPTFRFHLLVDFTNLQISPSFTWQSWAYRWQFWAHTHLWARPHFCLSPSSPLLQIPPTCRIHQHSDFTQFHFCQISPTCRFHQLSDFTQFHLTILSPHSPVGSAGFLPKSIVPTVADFTNFWDQIAPNFTFVRFHQLADFTNFQISPSHHLQISPTCRFHLLVDFYYLHLSCVMTLMISVVCVHLHVILTHCFLSPAVPQKSIFTHDAVRSGFTHWQISPTCIFHPLADFTCLQISPTCRFRPLQISPLSLALEDHPVLKNLFFSPEEHPTFKKQTVEDGEKMELRCVSRADCAGPQPRWMNARNRLSGPRGCVQAWFHVCISARVNRVLHHFWRAWPRWAPRIQLGHAEDLPRMQGVCLPRAMYMHIFAALTCRVCAFSVPCTLVHPLLMRGPMHASSADPDRYHINIWSLPYELLIATLSALDRYLMTSTLWASDHYLLNIWSLPYQHLIANLSASDRYLINFWSLPYDLCLTNFWLLPYQHLIATLSTSDHYLINLWSLPYDRNLISFWSLPYQHLIATLSTSDRYLMSFWSLLYQPLITTFWPLLHELLIATLSTSDRYFIRF